MLRGQQDSVLVMVEVGNVPIHDVIKVQGTNSFVQHMVEENVVKRMGVGRLLQVQISAQVTVEAIVVLRMVAESQLSLPQNFV